jgi:phosphocarrier protein
MPEIEATAVREVTLSNTLGLHARAAAAFVKCATNFKCEVAVHKDGVEVNGKSIMGLLMLAMPNGESFHIHAKGADADEAIMSLATLIDDRFGEEM